MLDPQLTLLAMGISSLDASGSSPARGRGIPGFMHWLADMVHHAFGDPREEALTQPPAVGVQPYRDRRPRRR